MGSFRGDAVEVDGHSIQDITAALTAPGDSRPRSVLARTVFGRGVPVHGTGIPVSQKHLPVQQINWRYPLKYRISFGALACIMIAGSKPYTKIAGVSVNAASQWNDVEVAGDSPESRFACVAFEEPSCRIAARNAQPGQMAEY